MVALILAICEPFRYRNRSTPITPAASHTQATSPVRAYWPPIRATTHSTTRSRSKMKSNQTPNIVPVPFSRAILPSMQSTTKLRWNSSAPATSHQRSCSAKQAAAPSPKRNARKDSRFGVIQRYGATNRTRCTATGSTSRTVHQASRDL